MKTRIPGGSAGSVRGSVVRQPDSAHVIRIEASRVNLPMDDLSYQISVGLPEDWVPVRQSLVLPQHTSNVCSASNGARTIMFLCVRGPFTSAMPLFNVNSALRKSGVEAVWLFEDKPIPSTKHMPCAAIQLHGGTLVATIANACHNSSAVPQAMDVALLARAAAEERMHVADFRAGSKVNVSFTSEAKSCISCGARSFDIQQATFQPAGHVGAPALTLSRSRIGRHVSSMITDALKQQRSQPKPNCNVCQHESGHTLSLGAKGVHMLSNVELSKLAAYELLRHNTTAWYVS